MRKYTFGLLQQLIQPQIDHFGLLFLYHVSYTYDIYGTQPE